MNNIKLISLDAMSLKEINGGSEHSYELGERLGDAIRKTLVAISIVALFF